MTDPYKILGVSKTATADEIRSAYRKLAKKHHPDLNPGNKVAEERFKEIASAHDILADPDKRAQYDRGEIDASGAERHERANYRQYADQGFGGGYGAAPGMSDIFADLFAQSERQAGPRRGRDAQYTLSVDFVDAVLGSPQRVSLPDGRSLDVRVPPGMEDGQTLRLRGQGGEGVVGGPAGDALVTIHIAPHKLFRREGDDILIDLPVSLKEAVLGGKVTVPTVSGAVAVSVPKRSDSGTVLRLRGRGVPARGKVPAGDQLVTLKVVLSDVDAALETFLRDWAPTNPTDPRKGLSEET